MTSIAKRLFAALAASLILSLALVAAGVRPSGAQQTTVLPGAAAEPTLLPGGMQILAVPYLWLGGVHETVTTPIPRASSVNIAWGFTT